MIGDIKKFKGGSTYIVLNDNGTMRRIPKYKKVYLIKVIAYYILRIFKTFTLDEVEYFITHKEFKKYKK